MKTLKRIIFSVFGLAAMTILASAIWRLWFSDASFPERFGHLADTVVAAAFAEETKPAGPGGTGQPLYDFASESVGAAPKTFVPVVGNWIIGEENGNRLLMVDGRHWSSGQTAAGIAERAKSLYGERYGEFLDSVKAFAYFPYAVAAGIEDFRKGEITVRFKGIEGRIDQAAGILLDLKPNGDYLAMRANPLENNLVLWKFERGKRSSVKWVKDTPTPTKQWHELKLIVRGNTVEGYIDAKLYLTHTLPTTVSGRVGLWSKADSVVYFDDFKVKSNP